MSKRTNRNVFLRLMLLVKPMFAYILLAVILGLISNLFATMISVFGGMAVYRSLGFETLYSLKTLFIFIAFFAFFKGILRYGEQAMNHYVAFKILAFIRNQVFLVLRKLAPAKLEVKDKGNLISIITGDIELLEVFYAHTLSPILIAGLMTIFMSCFIGSYHIILGIIAFGVYIAIGLILPIFMSRKSTGIADKYREKSGELSSYVLENLRGVTQTIQFQNDEYRLMEMNHKMQNLSETEKTFKKISGRNLSIINLAILTSIIVMLFVSYQLYVKGIISFEGVLIPVITLMSSFGPVVALANLGTGLSNTLAAGNRVLDILDESPQVNEVIHGERVVFSGAEVENIEFGYQDKKVLNKVSMVYPEQRIIGIQGKSGSGKSTLIRLIMRFWDVQSGNIAISQKNIKQINTKNLREIESYVTQETHLFHDTIRNNVKVAKLEATDEEIIRACQKASIHDFINKLPMGYETQIGELGDTLSGGERQRLGLARAFLSGAPLMILDEPTSNLDSLNEAVILKSIKDEAKDKTVIIVSHRASTLGISDRTYAIKDGMSALITKYE
ncbi:amino acid ABC transporter ATP-binding/permease protein [Fusibacter bizertensis]